MASMCLQYSTHAIILTLRRMSGGQDCQASSKVHLSTRFDQGANHLQPRSAVQGSNNIHRADVNGDKGWVVLEMKWKEKISSVESLGSLAQG
jgi:hypothetical protein